MDTHEPCNEISTRSECISYAFMRKKEKKKKKELLKMFLGICRGSFASFDYFIKNYLYILIIAIENIHDHVEGNFSNM